MASDLIPSSVVEKRHTALPGRVLVVLGKIVHSDKPLEGGPVFCRSAVILKAPFEKMPVGSVIAENAFVCDVLTGEDVLIARTYALPIGHIAFDADGIRIPGCREDSWMRMSRQDAEDEIRRVLQLSTWEEEHKLACFTLDAVNARAAQLAQIAS